MKRVLLIQFEDELLRLVAEALSQKVEVSHLNFGRAPTTLNSSAEADQTTLLKNFHYQAFRDRNNPSDLADLHWLEDLPGSFRNSLDLSCDRVFWKPLTNSERLRYLAGLRRSIRPFVDSVAADVAIFHLTPHFPWDLVTMRLLLEKGLSVVALRSTQIDDFFVAVKMSAEDATSAFVQKIPSDRKGPRPPKLDPLNHPRELQSRRLQRAQRFESKSSKSSRLLLSGLTAIAHETVASFKSTMANLWRHCCSAPRKQSSNYMDIYNTWTRLWLSSVAALRTVRYAKRLRSVARELPQGDFVLLLLHYQPEQNSDPESGIFRHQQDTVLFVRKLLDEADLENFALVVKEHPRQPNPRFANGRHLWVRPPDFYEAVARLDRVRWLRDDIESPYAIAASRMVITPNGSGAWQAALSGRPGLTLARSWHEDCASCPSLPSLLSSNSSLRGLIETDERSVLAEVNSFLERENILYFGAAMTALAGDLSGARRSEYAVQMSAELYHLVKSL